MRSLLFLFIMILCAATGLSNTIRVPQDYATVQAGINAALSGDTVLVAAGTYHELIDFSGKAIVVTSESGPIATVINGDAAGTVVTFKNNEGPDSVLDGLTITGGYAHWTGGVYCKEAHPTLVNNIIMLNQSESGGGGLYSIESDIVLFHNTIMQNASEEGCGGLDLVSGIPSLEENLIMENIGVCGGVFCAGLTLDAHLTGNIIKDNWGDEGGGVNLHCHPTMQGNSITGNSATKGAGIYCLNAIASIIDNEIQDNHAVEDGGGLYIFEQGRPTLKGNTITGNTANRGGGIYMKDAYPSNVKWPRITRNILQENSSVLEGGAIYMLNSNPILTDNLFRKNTAGNGGAIYAETSEAALVHNTVTGNSASVGGGLFCDGSPSPWAANTIFWNDLAGSDPEVHAQSGATPLITYCDVQGGFPGTGNLDADPLFANPAAGDFHLQFGSPCIDSGDNTATYLPAIDFEEDPRVADGNGDGVAVTDMGMDEFLTLDADASTLPESTGGVVNFSLNAGPPNGLRKYILLGSISGTSPGVPLPGGHVTLPLNLDYFTDLVLLYLNTPLFDNFLGVLSGTGQGWAKLDATGVIPPGATGSVMVFSFAINAPFNFVSNYVEVEVTP